jgi:GT2 family glycosyltransferase
VDSLSSSQDSSPDHLPVEVVVLIVAYNGRKDLAGCLPTVCQSDDSPYLRRIVVVDNASRDDVGEWLAREYPEVVYYRSEENLGFAGGNNLGWEVIQQRFPRTKYVALLNQDTVVASGWLARVVDYLESHPEVACGQSKLLLHPETTLFNTAGNVCQFLGFGFTTAYREKDEGQHDTPRSIDFPSGAACLVRSEAIRHIGLFDSQFFLYHEDTELGWKIRLAGWDVRYVPSSVVYHKYVHKGDYRHYYYLERNRLWLLFVHYRIATLMLIAPAAVLMEGGAVGVRAVARAPARQAAFVRLFLPAREPGAAAAAAVRVAGETQDLGPRVSWAIQGRRRVLRAPVARAAVGGEPHLQRLLVDRSAVNLLVNGPYAREVRTMSILVTGAKGQLGA